MSTLDSSSGVSSIGVVFCPYCGQGHGYRRRNGAVACAGCDAVYAPSRRVWIHQDEASRLESVADVEESRALRVAQLRILSGPDAGRSREIRTGPFRIGRGDVEFRLTDPKVSRQHALLLWDGGFVLQDEGSLNGTWVDETRIERLQIHDGFRFRVGDTIFGVTLHAPEALPPTAPARGPWVFIVESGPDTGESFSPTEFPQVIGRRHADLKLTDNMVSRQHAVIERHGSAYLLRDLGSRFGTYYEAERIEVALLTERTRIAVGRSVIRVDRGQVT